jgi:transposase
LLATSIHGLSPLHCELSGRISATGRLHEHDVGIAALCAFISIRSTLSEAAMATSDARVEDNLGPFRTAVELIMSILGIKSLSAQVIVSEIGIDMSRFPICLRNDESSGKRRSNRSA